MRRLSLVVLLTGVFVVGLVCQANAAAVLLNPGDNNVAAVTDVIPASALLASITAPFTHTFGTVTVSGSVYQEVRRVNADSLLLFTYQVTNSASSDDPFSRITAINFAGFDTWVAYVASSSVAPDTFDRSGGSGTTVGFDFDNGIPAGSVSTVLGIKTDAYIYRAGQVSVINGGSENVDVYGPAPGTPEPSSMILLGMGLLGFSGGIFRKRFRA